VRLLFRLPAFTPNSPFPSTFFLSPPRHTQRLTLLFSQPAPFPRIEKILFISSIGTFLRPLPLHGLRSHELLCTGHFVIKLFSTKQFGLTPARLRTQMITARVVTFITRITKCPPLSASYTLIACPDSFRQKPSFTPTYTLSGRLSYARHAGSVFYFAAVVSSLSNNLTISRTADSHQRLVPVLAKT